MLWTTTSELLFEFPIFNRHCAILRGFLFTKSSSFEQQNSHPAESTKPRHSLGFFYWKNSFVAFADFAIRLLVWLMLTYHPPSQSRLILSLWCWESKGGVLLTNDQSSISLLLMIVSISSHNQYIQSLLFSGLWLHSLYTNSAVYVPWLSICLFTRPQGIKSCWA